MTRFREERGSVIVLTAVVLPILLLITSLVIDVGTWYEHKRHLQMQADAAAFAGGGEFHKCFTDSALAEVDIEATTRRYSGQEDLAGSYNRQVPNHLPINEENVLLNSTTFKNGRVDPDPPAAPPFCDAMELDVKLTEEGAPWVFRIANFLGSFLGDAPLITINAQARIEIQRATVQSGMLPFAVPEVQPLHVYATFVDEATGAPIPGCPSGCTVELTKNDASSPSNGLDIWDNSSAPFTVPIDAANVGVRITINESNDPAASCDGMLVGCYLEASSRGVVAIRGWGATACASGTNCPTAQDVRLLPGDCAPDAYFSVAECDMGISAEIDVTDHEPAGFDVVARVNGHNYPLDTNVGTTWTRARTDLRSDYGANEVTMTWSWEQTSGTWRGLTCANGRSNPCVDSGSFGTVQRSFVADPLGEDGPTDEASGPLKLVQIGEPGVRLTGANTFMRGSSHDLVVHIGITSLANASSWDDPTVLLRIASPSGSHNQALDCDAGRTLKDEIETGCETPYAINDDRLCPSTSNPADCIEIETGDKVGQVKQGMDGRFAPGGVCSPNNWQEPPPPAVLPTIDPADPRLVPLIVTTWNAFEGQGSAEIPVVVFAAFYVTGWNGAVDCSAVNEPAPRESRNNSADVWGHFVHYIFTVNQGSSGTCVASALGNCVAVLTK